MSSEEHCPTAGGLGENGFNPDFDLKQLVLDPSANMHIWGWLASGFLTLATITISTHTIKMHLMHYYTPEIQRHKVRVLAYPAFYALFAWLSYLKYKYETVIMFCAKLFESFAVYNLYMCLQAYLKPYRERYAGQKIPITTKVLGILKVHLNSKWGLHFRVICDIFVFQFPVWNIISALISIITQVNGVYCDGQFKLNGAYVYLAVINFASLTLILTALFTYLAVFNEEWHHGRIKAHGMFWCVKGPIMVIFYFGDIVLSALSFFNVITDAPPKHSGGTYWPAAAIKNGYYVLLICAVMTVVAIMMDYFFGLDAKEYAFEEDGLSTGWAEYLAAFADAFLAFIPQFVRNLLLCGGDTMVLARKRMRLRKERRLSEEERNLLMPDNDVDSAQPLTDSYPMLSQLPPALRQRRTSFDEGEDSYIRAGSTTPATFFKESKNTVNNRSLVDINADTSPRMETKETSINDTPAKDHKDAPSDDASSNTNVLDTPIVPGLALPPPPPPPRQSRLLSHNDQVVEAATSGSSYFTPHEPQRSNRTRNYL